MPAALQEDVLLLECSDSQELASDGSSSSGGSSSGSSSGSSTAVVAPVGLLGQAVAAHCQVRVYSAISTCTGTQLVLLA